MTDKEINDINIAMARLETRMTAIESTLTEIKELLKHVHSKDEIRTCCVEYVAKHFVTRAEFEPVQMAYLIASRIIIAALVGGGLALLGLHYLP